MQTIFRTVLESDFVILPNALLRDKSLSIEARGMLAMILTNRSDWMVNRGWLEEQTGLSEYRVRRALVDLEAAGYAVFKRNRDAFNRFAGQVWTFYAIPQPKDLRSNPDSRRGGGSAAYDSHVEGGHVMETHNAETRTLKKDYPQKEQLQKEQQEEDKGCGKPLAVCTPSANWIADSGNPLSASKTLDASSETQQAEDAPTSKPPSCPAVGPTLAPRPFALSGEQNASTGPQGARRGLIDGWCERFRARTGSPYIFSGGRDGKIVKDMLSAGSAEEWLALVDRCEAAPADRFHWNCKAALESLPKLWRFANEARAELAKGKGFATEAKAPEAIGLGFNLT